MVAPVWKVLDPPMYVGCFYVSISGQLKQFYCWESKCFAVIVLVWEWLSDLGVCMLASGTQDRGFAPDRSRQFFPAGKIHSMPSFGREEK
jgi:hypothetical protein